jgi:aminocarboxymuconate-semialdehyde decarboxylase
VKLDAFCHVMPRDYFDALLALRDVPAAENIRKRSTEVPAMVDLDLRFRQLEKFSPDYRQIVSIPAPPADDLGPPEVSQHFARLGTRASPGWRAITPSASPASPPSCR